MSFLCSLCILWGRVSLHGNGRKGTAKGIPNELLDGYICYINPNPATTLFWQGTQSEVRRNLSAWTSSSHSEDTAEPDLFPSTAQSSHIWGFFSIHSTGIWEAQVSFLGLDANNRQDKNRGASLSMETVQPGRKKTWRINALPCCFGNSSTGKPFAQDDKSKLELKGHYLLFPQTLEGYFVLPLEASTSSRAHAQPGKQTMHIPDITDYWVSYCLFSISALRKAIN